MAPHQGDEIRLVSLARPGWQELEALWQRERDQRRGAGRREEGLDAEPAKGPPGGA